MTDIHWLAAVSGDFSTPGNWAGGAVPGPDDDAIIDATGGPYTVSVDQNQTVEGLELVADAALKIADARLALKDGTVDGGVAGTIDIGPLGQLTLSGTFVNSGVVNMEGNNSNTRINIKKTVTLQGGGMIDMGTHIGASIDALGHSVKLVNVDDVITGRGAIDASGQLEIINESGGFIGGRPGSSGALLIGGTLEGQTSKLVNRGTIEAVDGLSLILFDLSVTGNGVLSAGGKNGLSLANSNISGQRLVIHNGGVIEILSENTDVGTVTVRGIVKNSGTLINESQAANGILIQNTVKFEGNGVLESGNISSAGSAKSVLENVSNTILGTGTISGAKLAFTNDSEGVVEVDGGQALTIDCGGVISNSGLMATDGATGVLTLAGTVSNGGTISAAKGTVSLSGSITGSGEFLVDDGLMILESAFSSQATFASGGGVLELTQSAGFTGSVAGFSETGDTTLDFRDIAFTGGAQVSFNGTATSGTLTVTDGSHTANVALIGNYLDAAFQAKADGAGGVDVTATMAQAPIRPNPHAFAAAMAAPASASASVETLSHPMGHIAGVQLLAHPVTGALRAVA